MEKSTDNMVYLKDIVLSVPLPPLFQVKKEEINAFIVKLGEISTYTNKNGKTYVRFGNFFGETSPLNRVYLNSQVLGKVTNQYLESLEEYLKAEIKADKFFPRCIYVEEVTLPIRDYSKFPNKVILK